MKIKDLHNKDLSYTSDGMMIKYEAEEFFKQLVDKYPDSNPREMVQIVYDAISMASARRILVLRRMM